MSHQYLRDLSISMEFLKRCATTNRISSSGYSYDNNANVLTTNNLLPGTLVYDTENRLEFRPGDPEPNQ
jgi:hypothetical protein